MYTREGLRSRDLIHESWFILGLSALYATIILVIREYAQFHVLAVPIEPVATMGIAVSLYLGFKSSQAYARWWEARTIWGGIVNDSRSWCSAVRALTHGPDGTPLEDATKLALVRRHLAWINALAFQLRKARRLTLSHRPRMFDHYRQLDDPAFHQKPDAFLRFLAPDELDTVPGYVNPATQLLNRQSDALARVAQQGRLDSILHVHLQAILERLYDRQGQCERIKNTTFMPPVQVFGRIFTWVFLLLLPPAFIDIFENKAALHEFTMQQAREYMFFVIPVSMCLSWIFFFMEKISESMEAPFEAGPNDVPISTLCRVVEIDLLQMMDEPAPPKLEPVRGVFH